MCMNVSGQPAHALSLRLADIVYMCVIPGVYIHQVCMQASRITRYDI